LRLGRRPSHSSLLGMLRSGEEISARDSEPVAT
jgi:hypothetical protein